MKKKKRIFLVVTIVVIILVIIILMFGCSNKDKSNPSDGKSVPTGYVSENEQTNYEVATSGIASGDASEDSSVVQNSDNNSMGQTVTKTSTPTVTKKAETISTPVPTKKTTVVPTKKPELTKETEKSEVTEKVEPTVTKSAVKTPVPTKASVVTKAPTKTPTKKPTVSPTKIPTKAPTATPTKKPTVTPTPHLVEYITEITEVERTFFVTTAGSRDGTILLWHFEHDTAPDYPYITSHVPGATAKNIQLDLDAGYSMSGVFVACCSMIGESYSVGVRPRITAMSPVELAIGAKYSDGTVKYYSEDECFVLEYLVCDICGKQHK